MNFKEVNQSIDTIKCSIVKNLNDFGTIFQKQIDYIQTKMKNIELNKTEVLKSELEISNNNSE